MAYVYNSQLDAFTLYHKIQESPEPSTSILGGPALPALGHALAGSTGTAISNLLIYPLDLIVTRLQVQRHLRVHPEDEGSAEYKSILDAARKIYRTEGGILAFYSGALPDLVKGVSDSFLFFLFYNFLRQSRLRSQSSKSRRLPVLEELMVGVMAGACSKFFTTPISNVVTRKKTAAMVSGGGRSESVMEIARQIRSEKGIQGFWSGYSASLVLTLNPSITFFLHNYLIRALVTGEGGPDVGSTLTFLTAAISKAVATTITYPFTLAKARLQVGGRSPTQTSRQEEKVAEDAQDPEKAFQAKKAKQLAARTTVFSTILAVSRTEGIKALYEGLPGEVLKGFFSHGMTMLIKERVHTIIISLYYLILKYRQQYPSPQELAEQAAEELKERAGDALEGVKEAVHNGGERLQRVYVRGKGQIGDVYGKGKRPQELVRQSQDLAQRASEGAREQAGPAIERIKEAAKDGSEKLQKAYQNGGETLQKAYQEGGEGLQRAYHQGKGQVGDVYGKGKEQVEGAVKKATSGDE